MNFSIAVYDAAGAAILVPGNLDVRPSMWSAIARGGPLDAEIEIGGDLAQLAGLTAWLGYRIEIINANGLAVWWGDIATVEIVATGLRRGVSLNRLGNKVSVRYSLTQPGGTAAAADTAWASDTTSIARYGTFERRITPTREMTATEATAYGAVALSSLAWPHYTLQPDDGAPTAIMRCTGLWQRLGRTYYDQAAGLEENNTSGAGIPLGQGFTSDDVAFTATTASIHEIAGQFATFIDGTTIKVTGAHNAGNNASFEIIGTDDRPPMGVVTTNVVFDPADDLTDNNGTLGFLEVDDAFVVSGSTDGLNDGTHQVKTAGSQHVEIRTGYFGSDITAQSAGPTVTITRGNYVKTNGTLTNEGVGHTITVTTWGQKIYTSFTLGAALAWTVGKVEIRIRRVGAPADTVKVQLVADSTGSPGALIEESAAVAAADIPTETAWVSFDFANTATISSATYGLVVLRTGANDPVNFYEVEVDEALSYTRGALKVYDGAAWQTASPNADLIFRVLGEIDTGAQIALILATQDWVRRMDVATTGLISNQYRDGELTSLEEMTSLLDGGTTGTSRLIAKATRDRAAIVTARPAATTARYIWRGGGALTDLYGQPAEEGYLPAGEWVRLGDDQDLGPWAALSPVFVERAEYRADSGLSLEPEGQENAFDLGVQQG